MKTTISSILLLNALDYVKKAQAAHDDGRTDKEVRASISAQLMAAIAIEGIGNEIGEIAFDVWTWERLEKVETPLKWASISGVGGRDRFDPGAEPLQTVQNLKRIRNRLVHPKIQDLGAEIVVRAEDGTVTRHVPPEAKVKSGDLIMLGFGWLIDAGFDAKSSRELTKRTIAAIKTMRDHMNISGLDWIDEMETNMRDEEDPS
jgi:hypothetical protein